MRRTFALLLVFLLLPVAQGQGEPEPGEPVRVLEDPAGDYYAALRDGPGINDPIAYYEFMDMEWLDVAESDDGFLFTLKVVDIEGPLDETVGFSDGGFFWIQFTHKDWDYRLAIERPSGQLEITYWASLFGKFQYADDWGFLWSDNEGVEVDMAAATVSYFVSRGDLADSRGAAPLPGRTLTDFHVLATQRSSRASADFNGQTLQFPWQLQDRMPDTGTGQVAFPVQMGLEQTGHAFLRSDEPYRASNGEATTFLYTVVASNTGDAADVFGLEASGIPNGWDVQLPLAGVSLGPGESVQLPILVATPFAHIHGGTAEFLLEMRSVSDPAAVGRVELGVRYLEIPQPAGHHDTVYLHSLANTQTASFNSVFAAAFRPSGNLYFNTLDVDPSSDEVPVSAFAGLGEADFVWLIPLEPTLRLGLDVDMESLGETQFEVRSPAPMQDANLDGRLVVRQAGGGFNSFADATVLGTFGTTGLNFGPNNKQTIAVEIVPQASGDYIAYDPANELWIVMEMTGTGISAFNQNTVPAIEPGGWFRLPLLEYEDDISDAFDALSGAAMTPLTPAHRDANPGDVILFDVQLTAGEAAAGNYGLELTGQNTAWAQVVTDALVSVGSEPVQATVMVQVPGDAEDGERADLFLQAIHRNDPQRRGLIRLVVDVDTDASHDDDRALASQYLDTEDKGSPAPAVPVLAALGAAAWVRGRRHGRP